MTWETGRQVVLGAIEAGRLQRITGAAANSGPWLDVARTKLETARAIAGSDAVTALIVGYDAARHALVAILAQQGLRATVVGGHLVLQEVVTAQLGNRFQHFGTLRRLRNELEYPLSPIDDFDQDEVTELLARTETLIERAGQVIPQLTMFS
ncbi:hypothetical protein D1871_01990 [Nakamurella silvestris]|nr:hypothetical protein D1871_01990 [Nakamurella silvestris]